MRDPDFAPAAALLAYGYALTPLFAPSLRGGMPQEERKIVERTMPRSDALARRATTLDPNSAEAFVALGYANLVQRRMAAAEDAFKQALALNPNQADGLHGYSQLLAALGRIKESLAMREHLQAGEQFITNYTADTAEIYWLDGDTEKAVAMLQPFRPGRTLELALVEASAGRYREAAAAIREMPATNYPPGMAEAAAKILESAPAKAAAPAALPRIGNMSFAYMHVGAPERVLEFYQDEVKRRLFPADLQHLVLASDLCGGAPDRAVQEGRARSRPGRILAHARLAGAVPSGGRGRFRLRVTMHLLEHRFRSPNHIDIINQPRPEERALARVSKDGRRQGRAAASILRDAMLCMAPQDEVGGIKFDVVRSDRLHGSDQLVTTHPRTSSAGLSSGQASR